MTNQNMCCRCADTVTIGRHLSRQQSSLLKPKEPIALAIRMTELPVHLSSRSAISDHILDYSDSAITIDKAESSIIHQSYVHIGVSLKMKNMKCWKFYSRDMFIQQGHSWKVISWKLKLHEASWNKSPISAHYRRPTTEDIFSSSHVPYTLISWMFPRFGARVAEAVNVTIV